MTERKRRFIGQGAGDIESTAATERYVCCDIHQIRPGMDLPADKTAVDYVPEGVDHWLALLLLAGMTQRSDRARRVWERHRETVMAEWVKEFPGTRPRFWWNYDAPEPLRHGESQAHYLARHGLLTAAEKRKLPAAAAQPKQSLKVIKNE